MIRFIKGLVAEVGEDYIIVENQGMGYRIFMPGSSLDRYIRPEQEVRVHTYMNVREDALQLYGFLTRDDLSLFELLIGVNGIGPKAALSILSTLSGDELTFAILSDDAQAIAKAPGIGKKTAQKLILEVKDKLNLETAVEQRLSRGAAGPSSPEADSTAINETVLALTALGYDSAASLRAVKAVDNAGELTVEQLLKAALKNML